MSSPAAEAVKLRQYADSVRLLDSPFRHLPGLYECDSPAPHLAFEWRESASSTLLLCQPAPGEGGSELFVRRDLRSGRLAGLEEREAQSPHPQSMQRMYNRPGGGAGAGVSEPSVGSVPFRPDEAAPEPAATAGTASDDSWSVLPTDSSQFLIQPPGLDLSLDLSLQGEDSLPGSGFERQVSSGAVAVAEALAELPDSVPSVRSRHTSAADQRAASMLHVSTSTPDGRLPMASASGAGGSSRLSQLRQMADSAHQPKFEWAVAIDSSQPVANMSALVPDPAHTWSFTLDPFQQHAVCHLEQHHDIFVAAHTSAGKTVVAEYAIAQSLRRQTRVIYTSPIKALSNQKFHDFRKCFTTENVGLITGDVQVNQNASCLIMTTEILRSMLYGGSDILRELEWVIFDEVHYVNDAERGVVWEEVLILLPKHVAIILLSATVPNTEQFANWVGSIKRRNIYVISTSKRPVPLEHYLYTGNSSATSKELFLFIDSRSKFQRTGGYEAAVLAKKQRESSGGAGGGGAKWGAWPSGHLDPKTERNVWLSVISMLKERQGMPAVVFMFSRQRIDTMVQSLTALQKLDLNTAVEKNRTYKFFRMAVAKLRPEDRELPQVEFFQRMLAKGLGVHHGGVLPILKEVVELLFQKGLVKLLFATETFAMGVNMPAKTVLFDTVVKHDGRQRRPLLPGEYTQMAGRAGRRGLDATGTVIVVCKSEVPDAGTLEHMALGKATKLESKFRVTYAMILNLLRGRALRVEEVLRRSFSEDSSQAMAGDRQRQLVQLEADIAEAGLPSCRVCGGPAMDAYLAGLLEHQRLREQATKEILTCFRPRPGQLIVMRPWPGEPGTRRVGVLLQLDGNRMRLLTLGPLPSSPPPPTAQSATATSFAPLAAVCQTEFAQPAAQPQPVLLDLPAADWLDGVGQQTANSLRGEASVRAVLDDFKRRELPRFADSPPGQTVSQVAQELADLLRSRYAAAAPSPLLDPVDGMGLKKIDQTQLFARLAECRRSLLANECLACPGFSAHFSQALRRQLLIWQRNHLMHQLSDDSLLYLAEYKQRLQVLRKMEFVSQNDQVRLKGQAACELSSQCVLITELMFQNAFDQLEPAHLASLFSCFVCEARLQQAKPPPPPSTSNSAASARQDGRVGGGGRDPVTDMLLELPEPLREALDRVIDTANSAQALQCEFQLGLVPDLDPDSVRPALMRVVYEWARGTSFREIAGLTDQQEGIIVRCIQRLDELLKDARNAARVIGANQLSEKFETASQLIKRDIVFAASLYLDDSVDSHILRDD
ncbi:hypothetical protein BOX15_Mlig002078g2 [Macrostomum lignano]|uniref:Helicase SKI2W n=1 Tax=Macrostomum lignano TaxID=282301 RepID=A0A267EJ68_9PLAT|nr:hypothetical protein BOX15_Mlig002078g2 [Macrostomum lignano]